MPNVNIHETENIKLVWKNREKRRRQPLKTNYENGCSGEGNNGSTWMVMARQHPGRFENNILNENCYDRKQTLLENYDEDWLSKKWRWYKGGENKWNTYL